MEDSVKLEVIVETMGGEKVIAITIPDNSPLTPEAINKIRLIINNDMFLWDSEKYQISDYYLKKE